MLGKLLGRLGHPAEVERLAYSIRWLELERAMVAREAADEVGIEGDPTLAELVTAASPEWRDVLADHRSALLALAEDLGRPRVPSLLAPHNGDPARRLHPGALAPFRLQRSLRDFLA